MSHLRKSACRLFWFRPALSGLSLLIVWGPVIGQADTLKMTKLDTDSNSYRTFREYLTDGATTWATEKPPKVPRGLVQMPSSPTATLNDGALVDWLIFVRDKNPTKFDVLHPKLGALLAQAGTPSTIQTGTSSTAHTGTSSVATGVSSPSSSTSKSLTDTDNDSTSTTEKSQHLIVPGPAAISIAAVTSNTSPASATGHAPTIAAEGLSVPEPSGLATGLLMLGAALWWRRRATA